MIAATVHSMPEGQARLTRVRQLWLMLVVALAAVACSGHSPATVTGTLQMTGGPSSASQPGVSGLVVFERNGQRTSTVASTDGSFSISLAAGTYNVTGVSPHFNDSQGICRADAPVVVSATDISGLVVACSRK